MKIAVLPGDGIGTEIVAEAVKVLKVLNLPLEMETALVGGAAFDAHGHPLHRCQLIGRQQRPLPLHRTVTFSARKAPSRAAASGA